MTLPKILHGQITQLTRVDVSPSRPLADGLVLHTASADREAVRRTPVDEASVLRNLVRQLERERDEARVERDHFKARYEAAIAKITEATAVLAAAKISASDARRGDT